MATAILNKIIDNVRALDDPDDAAEDAGETVAIVTALVSELMVELTGQCSDLVLEGALSIISMMTARTATLRAAGELSQESWEFFMDVCVEFSTAICRLHS